MQKNASVKIGLVQGDNITAGGRIIVTIPAIPNGHYDKASGTVIFTTTYFSNYAVGYNRVTFSDVAESDWYSKAVAFMAARKITSGTGNELFSPKAKLTRAQFLVMVMREYGIEADANSVDNYADAGSTYYTNYLAAAKRLGISNGVGKNMFAPDKEIARQEMFTLLYNSLKLIGKLPSVKTTKSLTEFRDEEQIAPWAKDAMVLLVESEIISGNGEKLHPLDTTSRAEMTQVLYNLLSK